MRKLHYTQLHAHRDGQRINLVGELSELRLRGFPSEQDRVWPDACDVGLVVVGRTAEVTYAVESEEHDDEGDLICYVLVPTDESKRATPSCASTRLVIYND